jgi:broad specificity phosphatase PhoE
MTEIELRRHAAREKGVDALSPPGRAQAEEVGRTLSGGYTAVFVSPARRTAETAALFLHASGQRLPDHAVVPGLASEREDDWRAAAKAAGSPRIDAVLGQDARLVQEDSARLGRAIEELFDQVPGDARALAVGHSPLIEAAVYALTGGIIEPLAECEGVLLVRGEGGYRMQELRLPPAVPASG